MKNSCSVKYINFLILFLPIILICGNSRAQDKDQTEFLPLSFQNEGVNLSGNFYKAAAGKSAPTVIMLQGYPGRDGDFFGIADFLKEKGVNAYVFNYRGTFKSEGQFSIENAVSDAVKSAEFLRLPEVSVKYNIDTTNLVILGYSFGSEIAFLAGKSCPSVNKIITIAGTNLKLTADKVETDTTYKRQHLQALRSGAKVINSSMNGEEIHAWIIAHKTELDLMNAVDALCNKKVLLIGGWNDMMAPVEENVIPLYRSFQKKSNSNCKMKLFECGHSFNDVLPELHQSILNWVRN